MSEHYTLEIISHHPKFSSKKLRKYYVEGIDTIGVWGDEPFEILFKNHSWQKVQVKLTLDGTDILTGEPATTEPTKDMWVVNGYGTLSLKAWPETHNGGAQLVFTSANNSVAVHTHGDLSCRGIIAAAVYTESYVAPITINPPVVIRNDYHHYHRYPYYPYYPHYDTSPIWYSPIYCNTGGTISNANTIYSCNNVKGLSSNTTFSASSGETRSRSESLDEVSSGSLEGLVAVGAGQHVDQKITYTAGLIKPVLSETVRVKYMWWDDLVSQLREHNVPAPHASGFPGDKKQNIMSLGKTPRIGSFEKPAFPRERSVEPVYSRI